MRLQQNVICNCSYSQSFCTVVWLLCLLRAASSVYISTVICKKVAHTRLPSVGFWSGSRFLAVSLQVTWVINSAVGCHYFPPGLQLPPLPLGGLLPISLFRCLVMGVNSLPKTVTQQRCGFDLNPCPSAPESSTLTTRLRSLRPCILMAVFILLTLTLGGNSLSLNYRPLSPPSLLSPLEVCLFPSLHPRRSRPPIAARESGGDHKHKFPQFRSAAA